MGLVEILDQPGRCPPWREILRGRCRRRTWRSPAGPLRRLNEAYRRGDSEYPPAGPRRRRGHQMGCTSLRACCRTAARAHTEAWEGVLDFIGNQRRPSAMAGRRRTGSSTGGSPDRSLPVRRTRRHTGLPVEFAFVQLITFRDGKVDRRSKTLPDAGRSPRSRRAVGVGDVAGERGGRARRSSRRSPRDAPRALSMLDPDSSWRYRVEVGAYLGTPTGLRIRRRSSGVARDCGSASRSRATRPSGFIDARRTARFVAAVTEPGRGKGSGARRRALASPCVYTVQRRQDRADRPASPSEDEALEAAGLRE